MRSIVVLALVLSTASVISAQAQQCLHEAGETPSEAARRRDALAAARMINTIQANQPGAVNRRYLRHADLAASPLVAGTRESAGANDRRVSLRPDREILPGWRLVLDVSEQGYWFLIKDMRDACGFAYVSNQAGVIWSAAPIR
ncbi:MAG: hypothetical protein IT176_01125 [Acidobacteria bacterium]|nr:hypothetical protein [Acidobacteriota bacterium]